MRRISLSGLLFRCTMTNVTMKETGVRGATYARALLLGVFITLAFFVPRVDAAINQQINFQGKLTNPDGTNVADGNYSIRFRIYSDPTADATSTCTPGTTTCKWEDTETISVNSGIFSYALGSNGSYPLPGSVDFNTTGLYLGVKVGADAEMTPRVQFTAAPYAFNADRLGGIASSGYVQLSPSSQQTGSINISGAITSGGTYNGNTFTGSSLQFSSAVTSSLQGANSQAFNVDSGTSGSLSLGASNASGITLGKFGTTTTTAGVFSVNSGTNVPTADQLVIDNSSSTGVTTAGVNGLNVHYKGGAAAVEAAGMRVDYTPGTTSGGTWSGMRIVENTAAGSGVNSYGLKLEGGGTGAGNSYGIEVATGWDIGIDVQSGGLQLAAQNDPTSPSAGNLRIYAKDIAGRVMPKWIGPAGVDTPFQASLGFNRVSWCSPAGGTTLTTFISCIGSSFTNTGTAANPTPTATNLLTSTRRATFSTGTTIGTVASNRQSVLQVWRGNAAGVGGFFYTIRFGTSTLVTGNRAFVGLSSSVAAPTNIDPLVTGTGISRIGMAINANTGNWSVVNNNSGTAPTVNNLGTSFPIDTMSLYELVLFCAPNGSSIGWRVTNLSTGAQTSGSMTTNIPTNTTFLAPQHWITNNTTGAAAILDFGGWYLESDN